MPAKIPVNSIDIPKDLIKIIQHWCGGENDMLYAVVSTGGLTTGTIRPLECDTDEKWYYYIWQGFSVDLAHVRKLLERNVSKLSEMKELLELRAWEAWVDSICDTLAENYEIED